MSAHNNGIYGLFKNADPAATVYYKIKEIRLSVWGVSDNLFIKDIDSLTYPELYKPEMLVTFSIASNEANGITFNAITLYMLEYNSTTDVATGNSIPLVYQIREPIVKSSAVRIEGTWKITGRPA